MNVEWTLREMTLEQYVERLPAGHRARREYEELMSKVELAAEAAGKDDHADARRK